MTENLPPTYHVNMTTDRGEHLLILDKFTVLRYVKVVGGTGTVQIELPYHVSPKILKRDNQIRVFRETSFRPSYLDFVGLLLFWSYETEADGGEKTILVGKDLNELAERRIIAYPSLSAEAVTGDLFVDDSLKTMVAQNLGASATDTDRSLASDGFTVQGNDSAGPNAQKEFAWRILGRSMNNLANASRTIGDQVYWFFLATGIRASGLLDVLFKTAVGFPGRDQSWKAGQDNRPMIFGIDYGNLAQPKLSYDYTSEINYVYVGGTEQGEARTVVERVDQSSVDASIFGRREGFVDARNDGDNLADLGDAALAAGRPRIKFTAKLLSSEQTPYGRWDIGDLVTVDYIQRFNAIIKSLSVSVSQSGAEDVWGSVEFEGTI